MSDRTDLELPETMHIEDVHEDAPGERQLSPREITMAAIAKRAEEQRERELAQAAIYDEDARNAGLVYPIDEPDAEAPPEVAAKPAAVLPEKATAPAETSVAPAAAPMRAVVIDGQQWAVTEEQYAQLANLGMITRHALLNQPPAPAAPAYTPPVVDPRRIEDTVEKMQYGDKATAAEALQGLIAEVVRSVPSAPQIDQNAIVQSAVYQAQQEAKLAADRNMIQQEYPEIFADPQRTLLAKLNVDAIRQRNMQRGTFQSDLDIYREAGNAVYDALGRPRPGSQTDPSALQAASVAVQPRQDVIERKRAAPRTTQVIDRRAVSPETPRAPTGAEIVERMRQSRGQASMR